MIKIGSIKEFFRKSIVAIYILLLGLIINLNIKEFSSDLKSLKVLLTIMFVVVGLVSLNIILVKYKDYIYNKKHIITGMLIVICFIIKVIWVYKFKIAPQSDYETFHEVAKNLANGSDIEKSRYVALFPHVFGYAFTLSIVYKIVGVNVMAGVVFNVILSCVSMYFILKIVEKIFNFESGIIASLLWILLPSQIIYNMFLLSEPLYTMLILLTWYLVLNYLEKKDNLNSKSILFKGIITGVILTYINVIRPISSIVLLSVIIYLFIFDVKNVKEDYKKHIIYIVPILLTYIVVGGVFTKFIESKIDEKVASTPGITIYFGTNSETGGSWSMEDATLVGEIDIKNIKESKSADFTQKEVLEKAKDRFQNMPIGYYEFAKMKLRNLWSRDDGAVNYARTIFTQTQAVKLQKISEIAYITILVLSLINGIRLFIDKNRKNYYLLIMLFFIGLTIAHMFAEVAARYHYSGLVALLIMASLNFKRNMLKSGIENDLE